MMVYLRRMDAYLRRVERMHSFEVVCAAVILINTVSMTVHTELQARHIVADEDLRFFRLVELSFCFWYSGEMLMRLAVHRYAFFCGKEAGWHLFDTFLVIMAINEQASYLLRSDDDLTGQSTVFRLIRLVKVMKVLRVIRVLRSFNELRMILDSVISSVRAMLWVVVLIAVVTFMFSMCFVNAAIDAEDNRHVDAWSNVPRGMLGLLSIAAGGEDWWEIFEQTNDMGAVYGIMFVIFVVFFLFVVQNTVTSVFVEALFQDKTDNEFLLMEERLRNKQKYLDLIVKMFSSMGVGPGGSVTREQLMSKLNHADMHHFATKLDIQEIDLEGCFDILTSNGARSVDLETFVIGCIKLRGTAKSVDVIELLQEMKRFTKEHEDFVHQCRDFFRASLQSMMSLHQAHQQHIAMLRK